ncbi:transglycosylase domain-containing protein [Microlunatus capsulatus]|uniref:Membrane peptidoglycan carboxypeptidase n=1 Tax=Microlunatus capsulatus TaxID=99117 RepID=A0ABS4Z8C5_9ACTN|nr:transglycosylase domain-containing protein [Microlunatus capsulatus]MBP2417261.1 membrane peptidoglycan carboxypeptidase [Microlunatus capsulatus]
MADPQWGPVAKRPVGATSKKQRTRGQRWARRILIGLVSLVVLGLVGGTAVVGVGYATTDLPDANADFETATTFVYYGDGKAELGSFAIQNRQPLTLDEMPKTIKDAVVAAENRSFWTDRGISLRGMARAAYVIARGGSLQGGSTITQQYIKIKYLYSEQTATRKFKELFLAYKINKQLSKEQILEGYLNTIYFGHGAYGIEAASQNFFDEDAKKLSVPQAAVLASVINNPSAFDPDDEDNLPRLRDRYRYVLQSMADTGAITQAEADKHAKKLPKFPEIKTNERYGGPKGFLLKMVERELTDAGFTSEQINGGGLKITTTFDKAAQNAAVKAAQDVTEQAADASGEKASKLHAGIASVDVNTGEVLALYGGPNYVKNSRNWATTPRPTASTFKTYALAAGLKDGYSLHSLFRGSSFNLPGDPTIVRNEYSQSYGYQTSLLNATTYSINTAFVDLVTTMKDGKNKVLDVARAAGAPKATGWDAAPRNIPIGTPEVSPLNMASGYATFANDGTAVQNHVVKEVEDADGKVIYKAEPKKKRAVSEDIAHDVTFALSSVVENGTGQRVQTLNRPVAGKTGTNGVTDTKGKDIVNSSWFVGYTKQISTAVMYVAGDSGSESLDDYRRPGDSTFFGGTYPAQTWDQYMQVATDDQPVRAFDPPAYVNADAAPQPSPSYTQQPTEQPSATQEPTQEPTEEPSEEPSAEPSAEPSTQEPEPSEEPSRSAEAEPEPEPSQSASTGGGDGENGDEENAGGDATPAGGG